MISNSDSQLEKLKSESKTETVVILRLLRNTIYNSETDFSNKLPLTDKKFASILESFTNNSSIDMKLSKTQLTKIVQLDGVLSKLLQL